MNEHPKPSSDEDGQSAVPEEAFGFLSTSGDLDVIPGGAPKDEPAEPSEKSEESQ